MTDCYGPAVRSRVMKAVKSSGNKTTEARLAQIFRAAGITGWRRKQNVFGKPDFVFRRRKIALFTDGCFWHGHNCRNTRPRKNAAYWENKITRNRIRDREVNRRLKKLGWRVIRLWECEINMGPSSAKMSKLRSLFKG